MDASSSSISTVAWTSAPRRPDGRCARSAAEEVLAEERGEDVREAAEVREHRLEAASAEAGLSEAVVGRAPLGVGEHLVRLRDLPEPRFGVRLAGDVGMELARERPERALDLCVARASRGTPSSS